MTAPHLQACCSQPNSSNLTTPHKKGTGTPCLHGERTQVAPKIYRPLLASAMVLIVLVRVSLCSLRRGSCGRSRALFFTSYSWSSHVADCWSLVWRDPASDPVLPVKTWYFDTYLKPIFFSQLVRDLKGGVVLFVSSLRSLEVVEPRLEIVASKSCDMVFISRTVS